MKKLLIALSIAGLMMFSGNAFADGDCNGGPECSAQGNFAINTFAAGGGADLHGVLLTRGGGLSGAAGGVSAAGGISTGQAEGGFKSFRFWGRTITLGTAGADLYSRGGGEVLVNDAGIYNPHVGNRSIGVYSHSNTYATTAGRLSFNAKGLAASGGVIRGAAGQVSADGSIITGSPKYPWKSKALSGGLAAQASAGAFLGAGGTVLYGGGELGAYIDMGGDTYSESYRGIAGNTEIIGTNVGSRTWVNSGSYVDTYCLAGGFVEGGWVAGGVAAAGTVQKTKYGVATAGAVGSYSASGDLGCNFSGSAVGYTQTTSTQTPGYRGSIMSSSAGMQVSSGPSGQQQQVD